MENKTHSVLKAWRNDTITDRRGNVTGSQGCNWLGLVWHEFLFYTLSLPRTLSKDAFWNQTASISSPTRVQFNYQLVVRDIYRYRDDDRSFDDPPVGRVLVDVPTSEAQTWMFQALTSTCTNSYAFDRRYVSQQTVDRKNSFKQTLCPRNKPWKSSTGLWRAQEHLWRGGKTKLMLGQSNQDAQRSLNNNQAFRDEWSSQLNILIQSLSCIGFQRADSCTSS